LLAGASGNGAPHFFGIQMAARVVNRKKPVVEKPESGPEGSRRQRITKLLIDIEKRLDIENSKVTLGDFIRLTQLERELEEEEQPREIIVTWKDPAEKRCELK
jgi:hypothetical protein